MNVSGYFKNLYSSTTMGASATFREVRHEMGANRFEDYCAEKLDLGVGYYNNIEKYQQNRPLIEAEASKHPVARLSYDALGTSLGAVAGLCGGIHGFCVGLVGRHSQDGKGF